jgi:hypothetical protein
MLSQIEGDARRSFVLDTDITQPYLTPTEQNREYSRAERAAMACVLCTENDNAKNINLSAAVQDFAKAKARIVTFQETTQEAHSSHSSEFWYTLIYIPILHNLYHCMANYCHHLVYRAVR